MNQIAPVGSIYQAGTLSGNPLAMSAGLATLNHLTDSVYERLTHHTEQLVNGLMDRAKQYGITLCENHVCGMFGIFFGVEEARHYDDVAASDIQLFNRFFHGMLNEGVYLAPSAFEAGFLSACHNDEVIAATLDAADRVMSKLQD